MFRILLILSFAPAAAFASGTPAPTPEQYCANLKTQLTAQCGDTRKADQQAATKVNTDCPELVPKLVELERRKDEVIARCATSGGANVRQRARRTRADQAAAPTDTSALMASSGEKMKKCADDLAPIKKDLETLGAGVESQKAAVTGASVTYANDRCRTLVTQAYDRFKERITTSLNEINAKITEYQTAAQALVDPAGRNGKNGDRMNTPGDPNKPEGQQQGGGGSPGGLPNLPQIPPKQPEKDKTKEMQDMLKKQKDDACKAAVDNFNAQYGTCKVFNCQPELGRVESVCKAFNDCLDRLPAVPSDCPGKPVVPPHK